MRLSIVIPAVDEAPGIQDVLNRLQPWRGPEFEIILADGGSVDTTRAIARPLVDRLIETNRGRACQMNAGAAAARGEVLVFLHADTILPASAPTDIRQALSNGDGRPETVWGRFDVSIRGSHPMLGTIATLMNWRSRLTGISTGDQAIFMTRSAYDSIGGFPEQPLMEDVEICRRLKRLTAPACVSARASTSGRRWEERGVWRTIFLMWRLRFAYWRGADAAELARLYL